MAFEKLNFIMVQSVTNAREKGEKKDASKTISVGITLR